MSMQVNMNARKDNREIKVSQTSLSLKVFTYVQTSDVYVFTAVCFFPVHFLTFEHT